MTCSKLPTKGVTVKQENMTQEFLMINPYKSLSSLNYLEPKVDVKQ